MIALVIEEDRKKEVDEIDAGRECISPPERQGERESKLNLPVRIRTPGNGASVERNRNARFIDFSTVIDDS